MKNLIYQYWSGSVPFYALKSAEYIQSYANYIGAEYRVDFNEKFWTQNHSEYMNALRPIYDNKFHEYDNVLFLDMDIFPIKTISDNIFDSPNNGIAMAEEIGNADVREKSISPINTQNDLRWANKLKNVWNIEVPKDNKNRVITYNSGVVLYTQDALIEAKKKFIPYKLYQKEMVGFHNFYSMDQNYLNAMIFSDAVEFTTLDPKWNSQIYYNGQGNPRPIKDNRTDKTQFVHLQLRGRNELNEDMIHDIVNLPINKWRHR